jgi:hypothetical protein
MAPRSAPPAGAEQCGLWELERFAVKDDELGKRTGYFAHALIKFMAETL